MVLELIKSVALLLALCYLETFVRRFLRHNEFYQLIGLGVLFGAICVIGMMTPLRFSGGIIFDARSVIIAVAGLFGGPIPGAIAALIAGAYRWSLGGAGVAVGTGVIATSLAAGLLYRYGWTRFGWGVAAWQLLLFGLLLHIACVGMFMLLPADAAARVLNNVALPFIAVFTPATVLLGWVIGDSHKQSKVANDLQATSEALGESERRFRAIIDHSSDGITLKDSDGRYLIVNKTFAKWQNVRPEDMIGKSLADIVSAEQAAKIYHQDMEVVRNGKTTTKEGVRNFADGIQRAMRVTKVPVALAGGGQKAVLTILMDISDAKRTEQELRRARDEAISANQTKSEFLARMSHEFRTPLNAILGFSDILANRRIGNLTTERVADYSNDIKVSAELLLELVNDLLDIAAIEEGRVNLAHERIDIPVIVDESLRTIEVKSADKGIILNVEVADGVTPLLADRRALKQILLNLLTNAVKFTPPGGSICLSVSRSDGATDFIVSDTGVGIDADVLADLMRPAAMLAANTYRTEEGWGLGLTIVRALAELHGGRIAIVSKFGQGTTVTVTLPNTPTTHDAINDDEAQG